MISPSTVLVFMIGMGVALGWMTDLQSRADITALAAGYRDALIIHALQYPAE